MITIDNRQFLFGNMVGAFNLIKGYTDVFANLPDQAAHTGEFWFVQTGSSPYIPLTNWYRYPAGLYTPVEGTWKQAPISVEYSETSGLTANITDWTTFYPLLTDVDVGYRVTYGGKLYVNITGNFTATAPDTDTTNWASKVAFNTVNTYAVSEGEIGWSAEYGTLQIGMPGGNVVGAVCQENLTRVKNTSGVTINNGDPVYITQNPSLGFTTVARSDAASQDNCRKTIAIATEQILDGHLGYVTTFGDVHDLNTNGYTEGGEVFVAVGGGYTQTKPALPNAVVKIGTCTQASSTAGIIYVGIDPKSTKDIMADSGDLTIKTAAGYTAVLDQPVYEDLNFAPVRSGGPVANRPDSVTIDNVYYVEFTSLNNQTCGDNQEVPHKAKIGGQTFYPHLHVFLKSGESAGTTGATFRLYWSIRETGLTTRSGSVDLTATSANLVAFPNKLNLSDATGFTGPTLLGAQLSMRLDRIAGDAGDVIPITYGVHYPIDTQGSRQIAVK